MSKNYIFTLVAILCASVSAIAQQVSGTVTAFGEPVIGANISVEPGNTGTSTDVDGTYSLSLAKGEYILNFSYLGFLTQEFNITVGESPVVLDVQLQEGGVELEDIVVVGTRTAPRSSTSIPIPVDVLSSKDLTSTGQTTFDKALTYKVPSFNSVQTPVNDATSLLDPYEIRNMGPSRTLILINGKRKNTSSLLYVQTSPGRGETGADISAIPQDAVKRVEILRDGASAQYGSDAIAGVMNIILKDNHDQGSVTLNTGITGEGDGERIGISLNNGTNLGKNGFANYTVDFSKVFLANRPGTVSAKGEAGDFGAPLADVQSFLNQFPDALNINGAPETTAAKFALNTGIDISENTELYANAAYVYKKVNSFANHRTPYWRTLEEFPYLLDRFGVDGQYIGYRPTFEGDLNDYNATIGFKSVKNDWNTDFSFTTGGNTQTYIVDQSHNRNTTGVTNPDGSLAYRENSPLSYQVGGTSFSHNVGNIDISRILSDQISIGFGTEFRSETFTVIQGNEDSYLGGGPDSFAGNAEENSGKWNRYNLGAYFDLAFDVTDDFLINGTVRLEDYSDFGEAFVWKVSSRYKFVDDKVTLRGSASTGFRAPSLHQIYTQKAQYSFIPGQGIQVGGLVSNVSPQAKLLGIPQLESENSTNLTVGIGARPTSNFNFTLDYYNIKVEDRIVLSTEIGPSGDPNAALDQILDANGIKDLSFFVNAIDTRTSGLDLVANYRIPLANDNNFRIAFSGNWTIDNKRIDDVNNPEVIEQAGQTVVNATQEALFFTSRPEYKWILGLSANLGQFDFSVNNTLFGPTEFRNQGLNENLKVEFGTKVVTDIGINYRATDRFNIAFNVNNVFDVLPEWEFKALNSDGNAVLNDPAQVEANSNAITFNQRYSQMTYDGYQFSQLGAIFNLAFTMRLTD